MGLSDFISVTGASEHNLRSINIKFPKNKLIVVTGVSGSGKSSLVFDVLYREAERRYLGSLSSHARQFLGKMKRPDVEKIEGLSPAIALKQYSTGGNQRSTVGTLTGIYDYLQLGQSIDTLSGGEAQRLTLAAELIKPAKGPALYLFEEPSTGLYFIDNQY
ncbi:MAG: ATP-binding cassette domain-containing protein [Bacteroidales bacterium]|jgi:excinuclease ABC subunit A|nr:ATP-binding cassette domain-containing protein [Bacteroidales bacterium]